MNKIITFIKEVLAELKHVNWPSANQAALYTVLVIVISIFVALYLGVFDWVFSTLLDKFIL